jgi:hypothetical protein
MKFRSALLGASLLITLFSGVENIVAQSSSTLRTQEFGPVVQAYLDYLKAEEEVVDDRVSRKEITPEYYRRNMNRIRALRSMAINIARLTRNDYLPELVAATTDEFKTIFEHPPSALKMQVGEVYADSHRFLGAVKSSEVFYIFARLDPYEEAEQIKKSRQSANEVQTTSSKSEQKETSGQSFTRPRRVIHPE